MRYDEEFEAKARWQQPYHIVVLSCFQPPVNSSRILRLPVFAYLCRPEVSDKQFAAENTTRTVAYTIMLHLGGRKLVVDGNGGEQ